MMPTNPDLREKRQNQILDAAMQVFVKKGFHQARMDDIVEAANLSKGGVYWYFNSKEQIILAVLERIFDQELNRIVSLRQGVESVADRLRHFNEMTAKDIDHLLEFMPVLYDFFALGLRNPSVRYVTRLHGIIGPIDPRRCG
jgi:AcrR family transcriptional regulator